jgi:hypothetical protein
LCDESGFFDDECLGTDNPEPEECDNGIDDDCDGAIDDECPWPGAE